MNNDRDKHRNAPISPVRGGPWIVIVLLSLAACAILFLVGVREPLHLIVAWVMFIALSEYLRRRFSSSEGTAFSHDGISDIVALFDANGRIIRLSGNVEGLLGYAPESDGPLHIEDIIQPGEEPIIAKAIRFCMESPDETGSAEIQLVNRSGEARPFFLKCKRHSDAGRPAIRMVFTPIDESDSADDIVDKLCLDFAESSSECCAVVFDKSIEYANAPLAQLVNIPIEQLISRPFPDLFHPDDRRDVDAMMKAACDNDTSTETRSVRLFSPNDDGAHVELTAICLHSSEKNRFFVLIEPEAPATSDNCKNRFELIFENTNDAIFITTAEGKILQSNPAAEQLTGLSTEELLSMSIHTLFDVDFREISLRQLAWMRRGGSVHFESRFVANDGRRIDVDVSSRLIRSDGEEDIVIHMIRDITERNRFLARLSRSEKLESLGVLAAGVALDFNNILEAIFGTTELALNNSADKKRVEEYLHTILGSAEKAARLTKHLMEYARRGKMDFAVVDLDEVVEESLDFLQRVLNKNIVIRKELGSNLGAIYGDPSQLKQAIINLILNAQDAMPDGGEILIQTQNLSVDERFARDHPGISPGPSVELTIKDSGRGIDPAILPRIFDPFFTTKERGEGTGLGLAITYSIITSHSGIIDIESKLDEGTTTRVFFPIVEIEPEQAGQPADLEIITHAGKTVMIVDDEEIIQSVLSSILKQLGYRTVQALNGMEALGLLAEGEVDIDVILLDMVMPGLSGWQTFKRIQESWPEIPVIIVTGYADERETSEILSEELAGFIEKPFKASQIARKLAEVFDSKTA